MAVRDIFKCTALAWLLTIVASIAEAQEKPLKAGDRRNCRPDAAPLTQYHNGSSCYLVGLACHYCTYDQNGRLKGEKTHPCGVCFGFKF